MSFYYLSTIIPTPTTNTRFTRASTNNILTRNFLVNVERSLSFYEMKDEAFGWLVGYNSSP